MQRTKSQMPSNGILTIAEQVLQGPVLGPPRGRLQLLQRRKPCNESYRMIDLFQTYFLQYDLFFPMAQRNQSRKDDMRLPGC